MIRPRGDSGIHGPRTLRTLVAGAATALALSTAAAAESDAPLVFDASNWPPAAKREAGPPSDTASAPSSTAESLASKSERLQQQTRDALAGDPEAAYALGRRFAEKDGPRARARALEWLGRAAGAGHADAMFHLSRVQARIAPENARRGGNERMREAPEWETWRERARRAGSLEAFAAGCRTAFERDAPPALRDAGRVDCYVGRALAAPGSASRAWFESKWGSLPDSGKLPQKLVFRAALVPHAHLLAGDPIVLATRILPSTHATWRGGDLPLVPLVPGHGWTWEGRDGTEIEERVTDRVDRDGTSWYAIETRSSARREAAEPRLVRVDAQGLHELDVPLEDASASGSGVGAAGRLVFPFPAGEGSEVVVERADGEVEVVRVLREGVVVQTPAGRFECVRYAYSLLDADSDRVDRSPPTMILDYAPGVGLVRTTSPIEGPPTALVGYDLSTPVPAAPR